MLQFNGKWTLITGASSGIGKAFAERLAGLGAKLVLVARDQAALDELAEALKQQHNIEVFVISKDLTHLDAPQEIFDTLQSKGIIIDVLINNAGMGVFGKLHTTQLAKNQQLLMLNIVALSSLTQLFITPMLAKKSGIIINLSSVAAFQPLAYLSNYAASKAFVINFTEALWAEYTSEGIQILSLCPGPTETNFFKIMGVKSHKEKLDDPKIVVEKALKALDQKKIYTICGPISNFLSSQLPRFFPHKLVAKVAKKVMQSRH